MFPMKMEFTINNLDEFVAISQVLNPNRVQTVAAPADTTPKEPQKGKAPPTAAASSAQPAATPATPAKTAAASGGEKEYSVADAQRLTLAAVKAGKKDDAVVLLEKYNAGTKEVNGRPVRTADQLPAENIADYCRELEELLK